MIRIKFNIEYSISEGTAGAKELGLAPPWNGTNDQMDDGGTFRRKIFAGASDVLIDLNGLATGRLLAIKTDNTITIKKNSSAGEPWTIKPLGIGATYGVWFLTTDGITSLYVSNAGSDDAEVVFTLAGTFT